MEKLNDRKYGEVIKIKKCVPPQYLFEGKNYRGILEKSKIIC